MERVREKLDRLKRENERIFAIDLGFDDAALASFRTAFEALDPEGFGSLGISAVRQVMRMLRKKITSDELRVLFDSLDNDESGLMEMGEFLELMRMVEDGTYEDLIRQHTSSAASVRSTMYGRVVYGSSDRVY